MQTFICFEFPTIDEIQGFMRQKLGSSNPICYFFLGRAAAFGISCAGGGHVVNCTQELRHITAEALQIWGRVLGSGLPSGFARGLGEPKGVLMGCMF